MKESNYNLFFEYQDGIIGFNVLYNTYVYIKKAAYIILREKIAFDLTLTSRLSKKVYDIFLKNKFIIEDDIDELSIIKNILERTNNNDSCLHVIVNPTLNCNFECWYCYETHKINSKMSSTVAENINKFIEKQLSENKKLNQLKVDWFGGEPLLYYKDIIYPILSKAHSYALKHNVTLSSNFTTNGYLINQSFLEFCKEHSVKHFQITLDGHKERHNQVRFIKLGHDTFDKIIANIILCLHMEFYVSVRINISKETNINISSILEKFYDLSEKERKYLHFSIHKVWQDSSAPLCIDDLVSFIRSKGFKCVSTKSYANTIYRTCYADKKNQYVINYDGNIYKCTARDFTEETCEGKLMDNGTVCWNKTHYNREKVNVFNNTQCLKCSIMPICNNGCSQKKLEHPSGYCLYNNETEKLEFAKGLLLERLNLKNINI